MTPSDRSRSEERARPDPSDDPGSGPSGASKLGGVATVVAGVSAAWLLIGVVLGSQTALGMTMRGDPVVLADAIRTALVNNLPWIPATLLAIGATLRFPLSRDSWKTSLPVHLVAIPAVSWLANLGVVLGFWLTAGTFEGVGALVRQAAFWGTIRVHVATLVYAVSGALTQIFVWARDSRARELRVARLETQLNRARYQALNAQIRPHFLFNTLHTIGQLWRSGRADEADEMLDHLGSLFQRVQRSTDRSGIPLDEEVSLVRAYLAIEEARFPDRLSTSVCVSDAAAHCIVPPLILQPLVENAIRHGVSASANGGAVTLTADVEGERLVIEICDDGPGPSSERANPGSGTGLSNTRERLQHAYGASATFDLISSSEGGTCARMELPASTRPGDDLW